MGLRSSLSGQFQGVEPSGVRPWAVVTWSWLFVLVAQSCLTLCDPLDCSPPGSSVHGISQARLQEWVDISFSRGSSQGPNAGLLHCRRILYCLSHQELVRTFRISAPRSPPPPAPRRTSQNLHFNQVQRRQYEFKLETLCSPNAFVC